MIIYDNKISSQPSLIKETINNSNNVNSPSITTQISTNTSPISQGLEISTSNSKTIQSKNI